MGIRVLNKIYSVDYRSFNPSLNVLSGSGTAPIFSTVYCTYITVGWMGYAWYKFDYADQVGVNGDGDNTLFISIPFSIDGIATQYGIYGLGLAGTSVEVSWPIYAMPTWDPTLSYGLKLLRSYGAPSSNWTTVGNFSEINQGFIYIAVAIPLTT